MFTQGLRRERSRRSMGWEGEEEEEGEASVESAEGLTEASAESERSERSEEVGEGVAGEVGGMMIPMATGEGTYVSDPFSISSSSCWFSFSTSTISTSSILPEVVMAEESL